MISLFSSIKDPLINQSLPKLSLKDLAAMSAVCRLFHLIVEDYTKDVLEKMSFHPFIAEYGGWDRFSHIYKIDSESSSLRKVSVCFRVLFAEIRGLNCSSTECFLNVPISAFNQEYDSYRFKCSKNFQKQRDFLAQAPGTRLEFDPLNQMNFRVRGLLFYIAIKAGDLDSIKMLLDSCPKEDLLRFREVCPFHQAVQEGKLSVILVLLNKGFDITYSRNLKQESVLHLAAQSGSRPMIQLLVGLGADLNSVDCNRNTPLHAAGSLEAYDTLVELGADIEAQNFWGTKPPALKEARFGKWLESLK